MVVVWFNDPTRQINDQNYSFDNWVDLLTVCSVCPLLKNKSPSGSLVRNLTEIEPLVVPSQLGNI